jgi:hypothetical protein
VEKNMLSSRHVDEKNRGVACFWLVFDCVVRGIYFTLGIVFKQDALRFERYIHQPTDSGFLPVNPFI